jgi:hypothetical protein
MEPKFQIGQKVAIKTPKPNSSSLREASISRYANETGIVTNYYFMQPNWGEVFIIYTIRIGAGQKDIVLHEDEIK